MKRGEFVKGIRAVAFFITVAALVIAAASNPVVAFDGTMVLGRPTDCCITINMISNEPLDAYFEYGTQSGIYGNRTATSIVDPGIPLEDVIAYLLPNTKYYYRMRYRRPGTNEFTEGQEYTFHTQRTPGSTFTFGVQGDSHPERNKKAFDEELYDLTLRTALSDRPDFYIMMGDDFSVDTIKPDVINPDLVAERYLLQRHYLSVLSHSTPLFLVNGNHEQAAGYLLDGTPENVAVWAQNARNLYYPQPAPGSFYTGNAEPIEFIGLLRNYFAWTWGDALFVVIDPFWPSPVPVDNVYGGGEKTKDKWLITHGDAQYHWLRQTLEQNTAKWKFVFAHHVNGGGRGGVEVADLYEWGGHNNQGVWEFDAERPGWEMSIHQLMVQNEVNIFFQGHDHVFARQELDGVTYLTTPYPADPHYAADKASHFTSGDVLPGSGYTRVTVSDAFVQIEYVRTFLPEDENDTQVSGQVAYTHTLIAP
jgi:hypothetical protein